MYAALTYFRDLEAKRQVLQLVGAVCKNEHIQRLSKLFIRFPQSGIRRGRIFRLD